MTLFQGGDPPGPDQASPQTFKLGRVDIRPDLGELPMPRLAVPPVLLPVPLEMVAEDLSLAYPVVIGRGTGMHAAWRYDCWMVARRNGASGVEIAVSAEPDLAVAGFDHLNGRTPRYMWIPASQVWIERPADGEPPRLGVDQESPVAPPLRHLTRSTKADRVVGRVGWFGRSEGWELIVAVSDLYEQEISDEIKALAGRQGQSVRDTFVNVMSRRAFWRWSAGVEIDDEEVAAVVAEAVWLC